MTFLSRQWNKVLMRNKALEEKKTPITHAKQEREAFQRAPSSRRGSPGRVQSRWWRLWRQWRERVCVRTVRRSRKQFCWRRGYLPRQRRSRVCKTGSELGIKGDAGRDLYCGVDPYWRKRELLRILTLSVFSPPSLGSQKLKLSWQNKFWAWIQGGCSGSGRFRGSTQSTCYTSPPPK